MFWLPKILGGNINMLKPLFEIFKLDDVYILYDPISNKFRTIPCHAYNFLQEVKLCEDNKEIPVSVIRKHNDGYLYVKNLMTTKVSFSSDRFCDAKYPYSQEQVEHMLKHRQKQIVIELTKDCNFRCKYCILSDIYSNENQYKIGDIQISTLKKSIEFFVENSSDSDLLTVSFYGGEPLICFEKIKQCVEYTLKKTMGKKVNFTTTTNGSLLNNTIVDFMVKYDFKVLLSLDGPKEIHNMNRVYADGRETFNVIMEKLQYIQENFPEFFKKNITFHSVVAFPQFTNEIIGYFNSTYSNNFNYSFVQPGYDTEKFDSLYNDKVNNYQIKYSEKDFFVETQENIKKDHMLSNNMTNLYDREVAEIFQMRPRNNNTFFWPAGTCDIGSRRIFVDVKGDIFPCEKISYDDETNCIGNVFSGFDVNKVMKIIKEYEETLVPCTKCWCANLCKRCWKQKSIDENFCENMRKSIFKQIQNSLKLLIETPTIVKRYDKVELK